jgi:chemotaxis protein methyltransferase CheR
MASAIALFHRRDYPATITILDRLLTQQPQHFSACDLLSLAYANLGQYNQASYYCSKALEIDACATSPYYLMAHLAENSGNVARAKTLLKRIVYLDPEAALAYLELAALYAGEGDTARAQTMQRTARILLAARNASEILDPYRQLSVGSVLQQIEQQPSGRHR